MRAGRLIALVVALSSVVFLAVPARANDAPSGTGGAFVSDGGDPTAVATERSVNDKRRPSSPDGCTWNVVVEDDSKFEIYDEEGRRLRSDTGRWLQRTCNGSPELVGGSYLVPQGAPVDPEVLASQALASVSIPSPSMFTSPSNDRLYSQVRTWLWVEGGWWRTYSATASTGGVTTTVTAAPRRAVWSMGDGGSTTCRGPGVPWRRGMRDDATYCSYIYRHSSAGEDGGTYTLSVTVWFEITWTSNTGQSGTLAGITRSASRSVEVGEVQALETG